MASWRQFYLKYTEVGSRRSTYNHIPYILINFLCALVNSLGFLVDSLRRSAECFCSLVNLLRATVNPPSSLVDTLLYRCLSDALGRSPGEVRGTYLIDHDRISQILDEPVQSVCVVHVL